MLAIETVIPVVIIECPMCGNDTMGLAWDYDDRDTVVCPSCGFRDVFGAWPSDVDELRITIARRPEDLDYRVVLNE